MTYNRGDVIPMSGYPEKEMAVVTKPDRHGLIWIRLRKQWLSVWPFSELNEKTPTRYIIVEAKESW